MTQAPPPGPDNPQGYPASAPPPPPVDPAGQQPAPGYAAPPPPAGGYAAPPPPAAGGYPAAPQGQQPAASGPQISFDASKVALGDWIFFGVGLLMLIFSFFGWVSSSYASTGGWNGWPVIIQLLLLITLGIRAAQVFAGKLQREIPAIAQIVGAGLITLLSIVALIQIFSETSGSGVASSVCDGLTGESLGACRAAVSDAADQYSIGPGFGIWAYLILSIALVYLLVLQLQKEKPVPFKVPSVGGL